MVYTWGLTKTETEKFNRIHRKQLRRISHHLVTGNYPMKNFTNSVMKEKSVRICKRLDGERSDTCLDCHCQQSTPCQEAMQWYFEKPTKGKKYGGNQRITLPLVLNNDIVEVNKINNIEVTQFKSMDDLVKL